MKKICLLLAAFALTASLAHAQMQGLHDFIQKHKSAPAFTFAYLSQDLLEVVSKTNVEDQDWQRLHHVVKNIGSLTLLAADSTPDARALYKEALGLVPTDDLDELLTVQDGKDRVRIWAKEADGTISDLILLVGTADEFVLVCFAGQLELGNLSELAQRFNAAEVAQLARTAEAVAAHFTISPNPTDGDITLSYTHEQDAPLRLSVTDQSGRLVFAQQLSEAAAQQISLRDLPAGLYWVQLQTRAGKVGVKQLQVLRR